MKAKRRDVLKAFVAGAAGIAGVAFVNKAHAKAVHSVTEAFKKSKYPVEPAKFTKMGNLVFVSGIGCYEGERTIENHTKVVMRDLKKALEEAGSSMSKIKRCTAWIDDIENFALMTKLYSAAMPNGQRGTRSCMAVSKGDLPGNSMLIVDAIAYI
jgi:enamine deaminase RidA (YjgF/YER057c/UK114 family)